MDDMTSEDYVEWEVLWFPPTQPDQRRTYRDEGKAVAKFKAETEAGSVPLLCKRVVTVSSWEIVANAADNPNP